MLEVGDYPFMDRDQVKLRRRPSLDDNPIGRLSVRSDRQMMRKAIYDQFFTPLNDTHTELFEEKESDSEQT